MLGDLVRVALARSGVSSVHRVAVVCNWPPAFRKYNNCGGDDERVCVCLSPEGRISWC